MTRFAWFPMLKTGLSDADGSWKIIAMRPPRIFRIAARLFSSRFSPSNSIRPRTISPGWGTMRRMLKPVTDFPHPDSPTSPKISPLRTPKVMPFTARTTPAYV